MSGEADVVMVEEDSVHLLAQLPAHNGYLLQPYYIRILLICIFFLAGESVVPTPLLMLLILHFCKMSGFKLRELP
jgi:hypothetical protein